LSSIASFKKAMEIRELCYGKKHTLVRDAQQAIYQAEENKNKFKSLFKDEKKK
jgi:hypothetical protein